MPPTFESVNENLQVTIQFKAFVQYFPAAVQDGSNVLTCEPTESQGVTI